ncbi:hypothetical protein GCM10011513_36980 [Franconibacter daqui]|uniref:DUF4062 domain-containing protein n=1 Tax=Franconibacter daqui TaxID=2047724 RepID=UPI001668CE7D|nr:DUF4062 domain-containing protein [Franconibacter daqui]GGD35777.1 hypothetical protein GCM10011513_36980 [Franconibacter daqui]
MDKRYQVFVSSTFTDLEEERKHVIQTLMEMDCIPAGMELFPAIDEEQWEFIKKVIDDCDYYLLIIGGRYGSIAEDGLSYTEKEFDYAVEKGLKITVLVHEDPQSLPAKKTEANVEGREKLAKFIEKAQTGRLRRTWSSVKELPGLVALSMSKTIKTYPAIGWVRADKVSNESDLRELIELQRENEELRRKLEENTTSKFNYEGEVAGLESQFNYNYKLSPYDIFHGASHSGKSSISFSDLFGYLSPFIFKTIDESDVYKKCNFFIDQFVGQPSYSTYLNESDFQTVSLQFLALGLIEINEGQWCLTDYGKKTMMNLRVIPK